jgi:pyruvate kinase
MPNLQAVIAALSAIVGENPSEPFPEPPEFMEGIHNLENNTAELFGPNPIDRRVRIMVTMPSEAASDKELIHDLLLRGMDCARINCTHDDHKAWAKMVGHIRSESKRIGKECCILMDLGGPKARLGKVKLSEKKEHLKVGDLLYLVKPEKELEDYSDFAAECLLPEAIAQLQLGSEVWIDDGKVGCVVKDKFQDHLLLEVIHAPIKGFKLSKDKGINFPGSDLDLMPLTSRDLHDLHFVAKHADLVGYSFVQSEQDMCFLLDELEKRGDKKLGIVAKIETQRAVANLPEIIVCAAGRRPLGVMIARGDLAVEIGWQRISEMQEEILWICEAAHVPVIWATQVLENLVKKGSPSRAEVTDAAMSERAECVMLNKGPYILEGMAMLNDVLRRMQEHQWKKMPRLRALRLWRY